MKLFYMLITLFGILTLSNNVIGNEHGYTLGVFPYIPPARLQEPYKLVAEDLGKHLNKPVHFRSKSGMEKFNRALRKQSYDIAYVQPFDYIWAHDEIGYLPLARRHELLNIYIVALPDSPINTIDDLKGKTLALPPKFSAASQLMHSYLNENNIKLNQDVNVVYLRSHSNCMQKVQLKTVDACVTAEHPIKMFQNKMNINFKKVDKAPSISPSLFIVHPRVPERDRAIIKKVILNWANTEEGILLLQRLNTEKFVEADDKDYEQIRNFSKAMQKAGLSF